MRETFLNTPEDCQWLSEAHLRLANFNPCPSFKSAAIFGNEDCPSRFLLYAKQHPCSGDRPHLFTLDGDRYLYSGQVG